MSVFSGVNVSQKLPDGTKVVKVMDAKNNCDRSVKVPAEKADEFVSSRSQFVSNSEKKLTNKYIWMSLLGGALGSVCHLFSKVDGSKLSKAGVGCLLGALGGFGVSLLAVNFSALRVQDKLNEMDEQFIKNNS